MSLDISHNTSKGLFNLLNPRRSDLKNQCKSAVISAATSSVPSTVWHRARKLINKDLQVPGKLECRKRNGQAPSTPAALEALQVHC